MASSSQRDNKSREEDLSPTSFREITCMSLVTANAKEIINRGGKKGFP